MKDPFLFYFFFWLLVFGADDVFTGNCSGDGMGRGGGDEGRGVRSGF